MQAAGDFDDGGESGVAAGAFEQGDLGAVQVAEITECFLRETLPLSLGAEVSGELLTRFHAEDAPGP